MDKVDESYLNDVYGGRKPKTNAELLFALSNLDPKDRVRQLKFNGYTEQDYQKAMEKQRQAVEGKGSHPGGEDVTLSTMLQGYFMYAMPLVTIGSQVLGISANKLSTLLGASETQGDVVDLVTNLVSSVALLRTGAGAKEAERAAEIFNKYVSGSQEFLSKIGLGGKTAEEISKPATATLASKSAEDISGFLTQIKEGVESGSITPSAMQYEAYSGLGKELKDAILAIPDELNDITIRNMRTGMKVNEYATTEDLAKFTSRRLNRLTSMLDIYSKMAPEEQQLFQPVLGQELMKLVQLQTTKVVAGAGKVGSLIKEAYTPEMMQELVDWTKNADFPAALKRVLTDSTNHAPIIEQTAEGALKSMSTNKALDILKSEKGSLGVDFAPLWKFTKGLATGESLVKAEINAQMMNPEIFFAKALTDAAYIPFQKLMQSGALALKSGSLTVGARSMYAAVFALGESFKDAMRFGYKTFETGIPAFEKMLEEQGMSSGRLSTYLDTPFDSTSAGALAKYIGHWYETGSRAVLSADQAAKMFTWKAEIYMQAMSQALEEVDIAGLAGNQKFHIAEQVAKEHIGKMEDWLVQRAKQGTFAATFTDNTELTRFLAKLPTQLRVFIPYIRTPLRLFSQGVKMTPLGVANPEFLGGVANTIRGKPISLEQGTAFVKTAIGSAFAYAIWDAVQKGHMTGGGPLNPRVRDGWRTVREPYSIYIGDKPYHYRKIGAFGEYLALIADASEIYAQAKPDDQVGIEQSVVSALANHLTHAPVMNDIGRIFDALESARNSRKPMTEGLARYFGGEVTGFIPAPIKMAAKILDPVYHNARSLVDNIKETLPGWSSTVPPKTQFDFTNQYLPPGTSSEDTGPTWLDVALNQVVPTGVPNEKEMDSTDREILRLNQAGYGPSFSRTKDYVSLQPGTSISITPDQEYEWAQYSGNFDRDPTIGGGKTAREYMNDKIDNDPYYAQGSMLVKKQKLEQWQTMFLARGERKLYEAYKQDFAPQAAEQLQKNRDIKMAPDAEFQQRMGGAGTTAILQKSFNDTTQ